MEVNWIVEAKFLCSDRVRIFGVSMSEAILARSAGVHDGTFHADEVTACAFLIVFNLIDEDKILRSRNRQLLNKCEFICDVGGIYDPQRKWFDHHQDEYKGDLSSAGMVLLYLKTQGILNVDEYTFFNLALIKGVDDHDNGRAPQVPGYCSFSHVIANFVPVSYEVSNVELHQAFLEALHFTIGHITRLKERYNYNLACRKVVETAMEKYRTCMIFDQPIPWLESFFSMGGIDHPALFVIMPAGEHWKLRAVPPDYERRMELRLPLPLEWAGLLEDNLKKASGISGAIFCHKGRFTSVWQTKEDALTALHVVLEKNRIKNEDPV